MRILIIFLTIFLANAAIAQDSEKLKAAEAYVNSKGQQSLMDDVLSPEGVMAQMGLVGGRLSTEQQELVARIVSEELVAVRPVLERAIIEGMTETFTLDEINALAVFYASDEGASAMKKMNPFMAQTMQRIGPSFQKMQGNLARRIQEEMSK